MWGEETFTQLQLAMLKDLDYRLLPDPKKHEIWFQQLEVWTKKLPPSPASAYIMQRFQDIVPNPSNKDIIDPIMLEVRN